MAVEISSSLTTEALFDNFAKTYENAYGDDKGLQEVLNRLLDYQGINRSVLDVGCGPGGPASHLANLGFKVTGIDISQNMIDNCKANVPGNFFKTDMTVFEPNQQFDCVVSLYSLVQLSYRSTYSMLFKMASWVRNGGHIVLGIVTAEDVITDKSRLEAIESHVEGYKVPFMGRMEPATLITTKEWLRIAQQAGLTILNVDYNDFKVKGYGKERHTFITAQRTTLDPLLGPHPMPMFRRHPHLLSQSAWQPFAERLTRHEFDAVLQAVRSNKNVLDVGSGHGELPISIAKQLGKASAIEPNCDRNKLLTSNGSESNVEIRHGTAENLPYGDKTFDAAVALWILHYVDDLEKSLTEMVRVVDPAAPNARLIIVQGAPDNEVVNLINKVCAPIAGETMTGSAVDHQGFLLATAARVFSNHGFGNITLARVDAHCNFPETDILTRCEQAATVLTDFWYLGHPRSGEMKRAFLPVLQKHFADRAHAVGDQAVILIAKPTAAP